MIPGEFFVAASNIDLNAGRPTITLAVANTGDRPVQVGSHFHFAETNAALTFDRKAARGFRLSIAAGTAVRFEPGQRRRVELVALAGDRIVIGFNAAVMGPLDTRRSKPPAARRSAAGKPSQRPATKPAAKPAAKNLTAKKSTAKGRR